MQAKLLWSSNTSRISIPASTTDASGLGVRQVDRNLDDQTIDLWEHAALLYHAYEWHAAADAFAKLFKSIENCKQRVRCLTNSGLIQARLGDCSTAAATLEEAVRIDQSSHVILFLLGLVCYELHDYSRADYCFEICFDGLGHDAIDYSNVGLDFVLDRSMLHNNLRAVRSTQFSASFSKDRGRVPVPLDALPAECIFEAQPRMIISPKIDEPEPFQRTGIVGLFSRRRPDSIGPVLSKAKKTLSFLPRSSTRHAEMKFPPSPPITPHQKDLSSIPEKSSTPAASTSHLPRPLESPPPAGTRNQQPSLRRRPLTPFTPRDARGEFGSTRELARFIRKGGKDSFLVPRNARGEYASVEELSKFVQLYAPVRSRPTTVWPLARDPHRIAELRSAQQLRQPNQEYNSKAVLSPTSNSSLPQIHIRRREAQIQQSTDYLPEAGNNDQCNRSLHVEPGHLSPPRWSDPCDSPLELLQPAVYKPLKGNNRAQSDSVQELAPLVQANNDPNTPPTSASSSSNTFYSGMPETERKGLNRTLTLQALEGQLGTGTTPVDRPQLSKGLSPDPNEQSASLCPTPSSVATEHFFSKVLGPGQAKR